MAENCSLFFRQFVRAPEPSKGQNAFSPDIMTQINIAAMPFSLFASFHKKCPSFPQNKIMYLLSTVFENSLLLLLTFSSQPSLPQGTPRNPSNSDPQRVS